MKHLISVSIKPAAAQILEHAPQPSSAVSETPEQIHLEEQISPQLESLNSSIETLLDCSALDLASDISLWSKPIEEARAVWGTRWAVCRLATLAADVNVGSAHSIANLTDEQTPICERALGAKSKSHDKEWWASELTGVINAPAALKKFVLLVLHRYAPADVLVEVSEQVTTILESLSAEDWSSLLIAIEPRRLRRKDREDVPRTDLLVSLPDHLEPRVACFILAKRAVSDENGFWRRFLMGYRGDDTEVHQISMQLGIDSQDPATADWDALVNAIASGYSHGAYCNMRSVRRSDSLVASMPVEVAKKICADPDFYPFDLISFAEAILAAKVGADTVPVINIADRDGWFISLQ